LHLFFILIYRIPKTDEQLEKEREEECLDIDGISYEEKCLTLLEIIIWIEEC